MARIADARGAQTNMSCDLAGRLSTVTDALSNVTTFGYDNADRFPASPSRCVETITLALGKKGAEKAPVKTGNEPRH